MATVVLTDHAWPDVSIERSILERAGHRLIAPYTTASSEQVEAAVSEAVPDAILTCWGPVSARAIASAGNVRVVARMGVGLDNIDVEQATRQGAWVTNVPDYCVEEVSDHAVALTLAWLRGVVLLDRQVRAGRWDPAGGRLARVSTRTVGILGYGRIGRRTAHKLGGLGMRVLALRPRTPGADPGAASLTSLEEMLPEADVVILHLPLSTETQHIVDAAFLQRMRAGSLLVNCSRGGLVDTVALLGALERGPIAGAALDVVEGEPDPPRELLQRENIILTPHVGFSSHTSVVELRTRATEEVVRVLSGETPRHPCNSPFKESVHV
ncbi:MAG: C-terminal binding protein [Chloroflexi bacterium]|nr:C-terminal binding protein [Chloroflexota bacterium]MBV9544155.1 C-terminal binding protein [Chloroflexota bacterium]